MQNRRSASGAARFLLFLLLPAAIIQGDSYPRQPGVDIQNYRFSLTLQDDNDQITGDAAIDALFKTEAVPEIVFDLIGKTPPGATGMTVTSVKCDGRELPFRHESNRLHIRLQPAPTKGELRRFDISYSGIPADGLIIGLNRHKERTFFGDNFPDRCRHWLPVIDHPYDKAACEFAVIAPESYQVVANGALVECSSLPEKHRLTRYRESVPIATYCMVIGAARFAVETTGTVGNVPVQTWVYAADRAGGFSDYRIGIKPMELFSWRIGPFPYEKLANVQSKTRYGGMENSSNIFYSEGSVTGKARNEGLFAHEIAHQWFGDSVTEGDWDHIWLSEGFATYLTHVYNEYTYGRDTMIRGLRRDRDSIISYFKRNPDAAVVTPANPTLNNILSTNSYQKGGWFLHMLRRHLGDEAFWRGISLYYRRFQNANALTGDFRAIMEEVSGKRLEPFFHQWVYTPGQPSIQGSWSYADGALTVEVRQTQAADFVFQTALDIAIVTGGNSAPRIETVQLDQRVQSFTFKLDSAPADVVLDPNVWLLAQFGEFNKK